MCTLCIGAQAQHSSRAQQLNIGCAAACLHRRRTLAAHRPHVTSAGLTASLLLTCLRAFPCLLIRAMLCAVSVGQVSRMHEEPCNPGSRCQGGYGWLRQQHQQQQPLTRHTCRPCGCYSAGTGHQSLQHGSSSCCTHAAAAASCSAPACILVLQCPGCGRQLPAGWLLMQQRCANSIACAAVQQQHKQGLSTTHDPAAERGYAAATEAAAAGQHCTAPSSWHCAAAVVVLGWILEYRQGCFTCSLVASQV